MPRTRALSAAHSGADAADDATAGGAGNRDEAEARRTWGPTVEYLSQHIPGARFELAVLDGNQIPQRAAEKNLDLLATTTE